MFITVIKLAFSQTTTIKFTDSFDNNYNLWKEAEDENTSSKIETGHYVLQNKITGTTYRFFKNIYLSDKKDFEITLKLKQLTGPDNYGFGIMWNSYGWQNSFNFEISSNGYFRLYKYESEKKTDIKEWTLTNLINPLGEYNVLSIRREDKKMNFYINDSLVFYCNYEKSLGSNMGFIVGQNMIVMVDQLEVKEKTAQIKLAKDIISAKEKVNMGTAINSEYSEIAPIISPDGKTIYVARARDPSNFGTDKEKYDIWFTNLQADGQWSKLTNIGKPLNNSGDNLVISSTADNNTLLLEGLYDSKGEHISDKGISITTKKDDGTWNIPTQVTIKNYYNDDIYESFCPTIDRKVMIMSLNRKDSYGEKDLYVSFLLADGTYSEPKNMGAVINSSSNEGTPFIAPDSKTLYFYSYGLPGYGSADIFVSKRLDDTWTNWSEPLNMGDLINSFAWDTYFSISAKGDMACLVSTASVFGNEDIYKIKIESQEILPEAVVLIKGAVYDSITRKPMKANIVYVNSNTKEEVATATSDPVTGEYTIILPCGERFVYMAEKSKYYPISQSIDLSIYNKYTELKQDLLLIPLAAGETIVLKNILFKAGKDEFSEDSYSELEKLVKLLQNNTSMTIEIYGHTENRGDATALQELSEKRAIAVKKYLTDNGIKESRIIEAKGFGASKPIGDNSTELGRKLNRRVEFKIISI